MNSVALRTMTVADPLDDIEDESDPTSGVLPPPPPGISMPPPLADPDLPEIPPLPLSPPGPKFGFSPEQSSDGDLLDAASSLSAPTESSDIPESTDFKSVWNKRKSNDPSISSGSRDKIYERIERISTGKGDSLMERYSDRFGSDLDREIIILRKKDQENLATIKPTVEVISQSTNNEMALDEFIEAMEDSDFIRRVSEKTGVSMEKIEELDMDSMKSFFEQADIDNSGTLDFDEFVNGIIQSFRSYDEDFSHFFTVVNGLLGELPDEKTSEFISSDGFEMFKTVGEDPVSTDSDTRGQFFAMVNELLVDLPEAVMKSFTESQDFELYKLIAERYGG